MEPWEKELTDFKKNGMKSPELKTDWSKVYAKNIKGDKRAIGEIDD